MKKLMTMTIVLLLSVLLALPALAVKPEENAAPEQAQDGGQGKGEKVAKDPHESAAFKRQQATVKQREDMKARRDAGMKVRERNVENDSPGKTGL
jgi:hypothetical protein